MNKVLKTSIISFLLIILGCVNVYAIMERQGGWINWIPYHKFCIWHNHTLCDIAFNIHNLNIGFKEILFIIFPFILLFIAIFFIIYRKKKKEKINKKKSLFLNIFIIFNIIISILLTLFLFYISPCALFDDSFGYCCHTIPIYDSNITIP